MPGRAVGFIRGLLSVPWLAISATESFDAVRPHAVLGCSTASRPAARAPGSSPAVLSSTRLLDLTGDGLLDLYLLSPDDDHALLGDVTHTGGWLGVGTATPQCSLDVQSADDLTLRVQNSGVQSVSAPFVTALTAETTSDYGMTIAVSTGSPNSFGTYVVHDFPSVSPVLWAA